MVKWPWQEIFPTNYIFTCQSCRVVRESCLLQKKPDRANNGHHSTHILQRLCCFSQISIFQFKFFLCYLTSFFPSFLTIPSYVFNIFLHSFLFFIFCFLISHTKKKCFSNKNVKNAIKEIRIHLLQTLRYPKLRLCVK